jgi:hypothetical protein
MTAITTAPPDLLRIADLSATQLSELLDLAEQSGADGVFIYTYVAPSYPSSANPETDLDAASYALVRSWPDGRTEPKLAYGCISERYRAATTRALHSRSR